MNNLEDRLIVIEEKIDKLLLNQKEISKDLEVIYNLINSSKDNRLKDFGVNVVANLVSETILPKR